MSLTYTIDKATGIVTIYYDRNPDFVEFERVMESIFRDSNFHNGYGFLLDRHLVNEAPSTQYVRQAVEFYKKYRMKLNHLAAVVNGTAPYGMERMAQMLTQDQGIQFEVFNDTDEARKWLQSS